jgi:hypothetical protein
VKIFHSTNEAREFLVGKFENPAVVEDYMEYVSSMVYIRELTDSEHYFAVAYDEIFNGVKREMT